MRALNEAKGQWKRAGGLVVLGVLGVVVRARADAPTCRYDTSVADLALDRTTKLTWQRSVGPTMTFAQANTYCEQAGMRLPTVKELQTIVDVTRTAPAIDANTFPGLSSDSTPYWTTTLLAGTPDQAWCVNFVDGSVVWLSVTNVIAVRCVKGP